MTLWKSLIRQLFFEQRNIDLSEFARCKDSSSKLERIFLNSLIFSWFS